MTDCWVDGHFISAASPSMAYDVAASIYNYRPVTIRPWTTDDQEEGELIAAYHFLTSTRAAMAAAADEGGIPGDDAYEALLEAIEHIATLLSFHD